MALKSLQKRTHAQMRVVARQVLRIRGRVRTYRTKRANPVIMKCS